MGAIGILKQTPQRIVVHIDDTLTSLPTAVSSEGVAEALKYFNQEEEQKEAFRVEIVPVPPNPVTMLLAVIESKETSRV